MLNGKIVEYKGYGQKYVFRDFQGNSWMVNPNLCVHCIYGSPKIHAGGMCNYKGLKDFTKDPNVCVYRVEGNPVIARTKSISLGGSLK